MFTKAGQAIRLGRQLGAGGAGTVYEIEGQPSLVAKLYHEPPSAELVARLKALSQRSDERLTTIAAWPTDVLLDKPNGQVIGFVMPRVDKASEIHALHSPKSRLQKFPDATWAFLIHTAANIARAVATVHEAGFVIGDVNPKNILVTRQGTVALLDCDSFQFTSEGTTYRCEAGFPEYTPPELQGVTFREVDRTAQHDAFGLAVVIFQLLFLGRHPFAGKFLGEGEMPLERAIHELRFAYGEDAATREMQPPVGTLPLTALPADLNELFQRAFLTMTRPHPTEWLTLLESLAANLQECELHSGHRYAANLLACPWCTLESATGVQLFNLPFRLPGQSAELMQLEKLWQQIESVAPPANLSLFNATYDLAHVAEVPPFPLGMEVHDYLMAKRQVFYVLACLAVAAGLWIGVYAPFTILLPLMFIASQWEKKRKADDDATGVIQTLFTKRQVLALIDDSDDPLVKRLQKFEQTATQNLSALETRWAEKTDTQRYQAEYEALLEKRERYRNWAQVRAQQLATFEVEQRTAQFTAYLERQTLEEAEIKDIGAVTKKMLSRQGVLTAADVTPQRLREIPQIGESFAVRLLQWRRGIEQPFTFDARRIRPDVRLAVEQKLADEFQQLERDLANGPQTLQKVKQNIEQERQELQPRIVAEQHYVNAAQLAYENIRKSLSVVSLSAILMLAFFAGRLSNEFGWFKFGSSPISSSARGNVDMRGDIPFAVTQRANQIYSEGKQAARLGDYRKAISAYEEAIQLDTNLTAAHEALSYALFQIGDHQRALKVLQNIMQRGETYEAHRNLGLAYVGLKDWRNAKEQFAKAARLMETHVWEEEDADFFYEWGRALRNTGELGDAIQLLEADAQRDPKFSRGQFQLGCYYLWADNPAAVKSIIRKLEELNLELAQQLSEKMKAHIAKPKP